MGGRFVIDASATLAWIFDENGLRTVFDPIIGEGDGCAPFLWRLEVVNALLVKQRRGLLTAAQADGLVLALQDLGVEAFPVEPDMERLVELGRSAQLTAYDALYIDVALRTGRPMLTSDRNMQKAAGQFGVALLWEYPE